LMQGSLARKLRVLRAERGLTLRQAAEQAGVRPGTLSELERGLHRPHDITLSRVAKGYGIDVEELLEEPALAGNAGRDEASQEAGPGAGGTHVGFIDPTVLARWRAAVMDARRLREIGKDRMDEALAAWRESTKPEENDRARRRMAELLNQAEAATMALSDRRPMYMTPEARRVYEEAKKAGAREVPNADWEEIREAERFYYRLLGMVEGQQGLFIRKEPKRNMIEVLDIAS
jgi:transcriptional regulator with XRE-family HTH domain